MKVAVLTSTSPRHMYFAARIHQFFEVIGVLAEAKTYQPECAFTTPEEGAVLHRWFAMRSQAEEQFFRSQAGGFMETGAQLIEYLPAGGINAPESISRLVEWDPDAVAVFGTSLLRQPLLDAISGKVLNMHLGLSPYYRGSGTNFWPFYNEELEHIGVTIHLIDLGIDSGPIIHQGRPHIERSDDPHTIGCKAIMVGTDLMIRALKENEQGALRYHMQVRDKGKLYKRKDFSAQHVTAVLRKLDDGLIERYVQRPVEVDIIP
jgi:hypothetical protein